MKNILVLILLSSLSILTNAQETAEEYGRIVYELIINNKKELRDEFIDLPQYAAYIDNLESLEDIEKENMKYGAEISYSDIRSDFDSECNRILKLYSLSTKNGASFRFLACEFLPSKNFPDIGMATCYYIAEIPDEEEPVTDAVRFETIKTANGWRILDGFFDETSSN